MMMMMKMVNKIMRPRRNLGDECCVHPCVCKCEGCTVTAHMCLQRCYTYTYTHTRLLSPLDFFPFRLTFLAYRIGCNGDPRKLPVLACKKPKRMACTLNHIDIWTKRCDETKCSAPERIFSFQIWRTFNIFMWLGHTQACIWAMSLCIGRYFTMNSDTAYFALACTLCTVASRRCAFAPMMMASHRCTPEMQLERKRAAECKRAYENDAIR